MKNNDVYNEILNKRGRINIDDIELADLVYDFIIKQKESDYTIDLQKIHTNCIDRGDGEEGCKGCSARNRDGGCNAEIDGEVPALWDLDKLKQTFEGI